MNVSNALTWYFQRGQQSKRPQGNSRCISTMAGLNKLTAYRLPHHLSRDE